jgi:Flp pilus assembly pilin Flp
MSRIHSTWVAEDEAGQGLAEYALILVLIVIVAIVALLLIGGQVSETLSDIGASVGNPGP